VQQRVVNILLDINLTEATRKNSSVVTRRARQHFGGTHRPPSDGPKTEGIPKEMGSEMSTRAVILKGARHASTHRTDGDGIPPRAFLAQRSKKGSIAIPVVILEIIRGDSNGEFFGSQV
jgi:hypothetical protein